MERGTHEEWTDVYEPPVLAEIGGFAEETLGQWIGLDPDGGWNHRYNHAN